MAELKEHVQTLSLLSLGKTEWIPEWMAVVSSDQRGRRFDQGAKNYFWPSSHPPFSGYLSPLLSAAASLMAISVSGPPFAQGASDRTRLYTALPEILFHGLYSGRANKQDKISYRWWPCSRDAPRGLPLATHSTTSQPCQTLPSSLEN
jgi:hypothetical protein